MKRMIAYLMAVCLLCSAPVWGRAGAASADAAGYHAPALEPEAAAQGPKEAQKPAESAAPAETPAPTPAVYPSFTDVPEELEAAVAYVMEHDLMEETSPFTFSPELVLSRGNALIVLYNMAGRPEAKAPSFSDVKGDWWYTAPIGWASQAGLISGYGNGLFGPQDPLTREQLAVILYKYQEKAGYEMRLADLSGYKDADAVSGFAAAAVAWAVGGDVLKTVDGTIGPKAYATRGDMAEAVLALTLERNHLIRQESMQYSYTYLDNSADPSVPLRVPLRAGPGEQYAVLTQCPEIWHLFVLEKQDGWYLVRTPSGLVGYVDADAVKWEEVSLSLPIITEAAMPITEEEAAARLQELQTVYPDGKFWNNPDKAVSFDAAANNMDGLVSDTPCDHFTTIKTCNRHMGISSLPFSHPDAAQCLGFASMLSDAIFGAGAPVRVHKDLKALQVGDIIRLVDLGHSVLVTAVLEKGVQVVECNLDFSTCRIQWGRLVTWEEVRAGNYFVVSRYPEPESDGSSQVMYAPKEVPIYAAPGDEKPEDTLWLGEFVYVICRQADGWYLVARENGMKGYVQAELLVNLYRAT